MGEVARMICCICGTYHTRESVCRCLGFPYTPYYPTGSNLNPHICEKCLDSLNMSRDLQKKYGGTVPS
jgi:hypothetical protein